MGKIHELFVMCDNSSSNDFQFTDAVQILLQSSAYEKETLKLNCDSFVTIFSNLFHNFEKMKLLFDMREYEVESKTIQQLAGNKLISDVSLKYDSVSYKIVQHLFSDSFISKLTFDSQDFMNLPLFVCDTIANNKNIKQLILDNCDLSIEFLQAVLSSNNVIDHLEIVSLSKTSDNYVEVLDTLFSNSSISYLGIPITIDVYLDDYDFSKLLFNKNLRTIKLFYYSFDPSWPNFPPLSKVIRSPRLKLLNLLYLIFDIKYDTNEYLKGLTNFVSNYEGPTCTITVNLKRQYNRQIPLPSLIVEDVINLVKAVKASLYSISIELDTYLYRYLPREYQDDAIPVRDPSAWPCSL